MNTTQSTSTSAPTSSIFGSLKSLGRGIVVSSAVAVMGVSTMSAADASAAGVATGIRHTSTAASDATSPTNLQIDSKRSYVVRAGSIVAR